MHMSEPQSEGQVSEVQSLEGAPEPISPEESTAGNPVDAAQTDDDEIGPDAAPQANQEANETT